MAENGSKTLLEKLGEHLVQSRPAAARRYFELLTDNVGDEQQIQALKESMAVLGKSLEDLAADRELLTRCARLGAVVRSGSNLSPEVESARQAVGESNERMRAQIDELERSHQVVVERLNSVQGLQRRGREALAQLRQLRQEHEELLSFFPLPEFAV